MQPYFLDTAKNILISEKSDVPQVDELAKIWAQRHQAKHVVHQYRPLTREDIDMDTLPQQFSDILDYHEKLNDSRSWLHRSCYEAAMSERAKKEFFAIVNLYSACREEGQTFYRQKLTMMGYPQEAVFAVPLMPPPEAVEDED